MFSCFWRQIRYNRKSYSKNNYVILHQIPSILSVFYRNSRNVLQKREKIFFQKSLFEEKSDENRLITKTQAKV